MDPIKLRAFIATGIIRAGCGSKVTGSAIVSAPFMVKEARGVAQRMSGS